MSMPSSPASLILLPPEAFERGCPTRAVLEEVTNRWAPLILAALLSGPQRFSALNVRVDGISQKMLSQNLKILLRSGLLERSVAPTIPPQVTYALTQTGTELATMLCSLIHWVGAHAAGLLAAQAHYDAERSVEPAD